MPSMPKLAQKLGHIPDSFGRKFIVLGKIRFILNIPEAELGEAVGGLW